MTLQNPKIRLKAANRVPGIVGKFSVNEGKHLVITNVNKYSEKENIVSGFQFYEIYDIDNILIEKRFLEINFKPVYDSEIREMSKSAELEIIEIYGDYSLQQFR